MKKLLLTLAGFALAPSAFAQVEIGLKITPGVSWLRTSSPSATNFQGDGSHFSFGGGVFMDYFFGENYAFNTGLFLTNKGGSYSYTDRTPPLGVAGGQPVTVKQQLTIQYLEIPATIKLFTNEVAPDVRLYFQVGGSVAFPVGARLDGEKYYTDSNFLSSGQPTQTQASDHVFFIDANLLGSIGTEYQLGKSTKALLGISYHHGLIDTDRYFENTRKFENDVSLKNSVLALDLGLKF